MGIEVALVPEAPSAGAVVVAASWLVEVEGELQAGSSKTLLRLVASSLVRKEIRIGGDGWEKKNKRVTIDCARNLKKRRHLFQPAPEETLPYGADLKQRNNNNGFSYKLPSPASATAAKRNANAPTARPKGRGGGILVAASLSQCYQPLLSCW